MSSPHMGGSNKPEWSSLTVQERLRAMNKGWESDEDLSTTRTSTETSSTVAAGGVSSLRSPQTPPPPTSENPRQKYSPREQRRWSPKRHRTPPTPPTAATSLPPASPAAVPTPPSPTPPNPSTVKGYSAAEYWRLHPHATTPTTTPTPPSPSPQQIDTPPRHPNQFSAPRQEESPAQEEPTQRIGAEPQSARASVEAPSPTWKKRRTPPLKIDTSATEQSDLTVVPASAASSSSNAPEANERPRTSARDFWAQRGLKPIAPSPTTSLGGESTPTTFRDASHVSATPSPPALASVPTTDTTTSSRVSVVDRWKQRTINSSANSVSSAPQQQAAKPGYEENEGDDANSRDARSQISTPTNNKDRLNRLMAAAGAASESVTSRTPPTWKKHAVVTMPLSDYSLQEEKSEKADHYPRRETESPDKQLQIIASPRDATPDRTSSPSLAQRQQRQQRASPQSGTNPPPSPSIVERMAMLRQAASIQTDEQEVSADEHVATTHQMDMQTSGMNSQPQQAEAFPNPQSPNIAGSSSLSRPVRGRVASRWPLGEKQNGQDAEKRSLSLERSTQDAAAEDVEPPPSAKSLNGNVSYLWSGKSRGDSQGDEKAGPSTSNPPSADGQQHPASSARGRVVHRWKSATEGERRVNTVVKPLTGGSEDSAVQDFSNGRVASPAGGQRQPNKRGGTPDSSRASHQTTTRSGETQWHSGTSASPSPRPSSTGISTRWQPKNTAETVRAGNAESPRIDTDVHTGTGQESEMDASKSSEHWRIGHKRSQTGASDFSAGSRSFGSPGRPVANDGRIRDKAVSGNDLGSRWSLRNSATQSVDRGENVESRYSMHSPSRSEADFSAPPDVPLSRSQSSIPAADRWQIKSSTSLPVGSDFSVESRSSLHAASGQLADRWWQKASPSQTGDSELNVTDHWHLKGSKSVTGEPDVTPSENALLNTDDQTRGLQHARGNVADRWLKAAFETEYSHDDRAQATQTGQNRSGVPKTYNWRSQAKGLEGHTRNSSDYATAEHVSERQESFDVGVVDGRNGGTTRGRRGRSADSRASEAAAAAGRPNETTSSNGSVVDRWRRNTAEGRRGRSADSRTFEAAGALPEEKHQPEAQSNALEDRWYQDASRRGRSADSRPSEVAGSQPGAGDELELAPPSSNRVVDSWQKLGDEGRRSRSADSRASEVAGASSHQPEAVPASGGSVLDRWPGNRLEGRKEQRADGSRVSETTGPPHDGNEDARSGRSVTGRWRSSNSRTRERSNENRKHPASSRGHVEGGGRRFGTEQERSTPLEYQPNDEERHVQPAAPKTPYRGSVADRWIKNTESHQGNTGLDDTGLDLESSDSLSKEATSAAPVRGHIVSRGKVADRWLNPARKSSNDVDGGSGNTNMQISRQRERQESEDGRAVQSNSTTSHQPDAEQTVQDDQGTCLRGQQLEAFERPNSAKQLSTVEEELTGLPNEDSGSILSVSPPVSPRQSRRRRYEALQKEKRESAEDCESSSKVTVNTWRTRLTPDHSPKQGDNEAETKIFKSKLSSQDQPRTLGPADSQPSLLRVDDRTHTPSANARPSGANTFASVETATTQDTATTLEEISSAPSSSGSASSVKRSTANGSSTGKSSGRSTDSKAGPQLLLPQPRRRDAKQGPATAHTAAVSPFDTSRRMPSPRSPAKILSSSPKSSDKSVSSRSVLQSRPAVQHKRGTVAESESTTPTGLTASTSLLFQPKSETLTATPSRHHLPSPLTIPTPPPAPPQGQKTEKSPRIFVSPTVLASLLAAPEQTFEASQRGTTKADSHAGQTNFPTLPPPAERPDKNAPRKTETPNEGVERPKVTRPLDRHLLVLGSSQSLARGQASVQQQAITILKAHHVPYVELDGSIKTNQHRRNELFNISGVWAKYPQFFIVDKQRTTYWGGMEDLQHCNETGTLLEALVFSRPSGGQQEPTNTATGESTNGGTPCEEKASRPIKERTQCGEASAEPAPEDKAEPSSSIQPEPTPQATRQVQLELREEPSIASPKSVKARPAKLPQPAKLASSSEGGNPLDTIDVPTLALSRPVMLSTSSAFDTWPKKTGTSDTKLKNLARRHVGRPADEEPTTSADQESEVVETLEGNMKQDEEPLGSKGFAYNLSAHRAFAIRQIAAASAASSSKVVPSTVEEERGVDDQADHSSKSTSNAMMAGQRLLAKKRELQAHRQQLKMRSCRSADSTDSHAYAQEKIQKAHQRKHAPRNLMPPSDGASPTGESSREDQGFVRTESIQLTALISTGEEEETIPSLGEEQLSSDHSEELHADPTLGSEFMASHLSSFDSNRPPSRLNSLESAEEQGSTEEDFAPEIHSLLPSEVDDETNKSVDKAPTSVPAGYSKTREVTEKTTEMAFPLPHEPSSSHTSEPGASSPDLVASRHLSKHIRLPEPRVNEAVPDAALEAVPDPAFERQPDVRTPEDTTSKTQKVSQNKVSERQMQEKSLQVERPDRLSFSTTDPNRHEIRSSASDVSRASSFANRAGERILKKKRQKAEEQVHTQAQEAVKESQAAVNDQTGSDEDYAPKFLCGTGGQFEGQALPAELYTDPALLTKHRDFVELDAMMTATPASSSVGGSLTDGSTAAMSMIQPAPEPPQQQPRQQLQQPQLQQQQLERPRLSSWYQKTSRFMGSELGEAATNGQSIFSGGGTNAHSLFSEDETNTRSIFSGGDTNVHSMFSGTDDTGEDSTSDFMDSTIKDPSASELRPDAPGDEPESGMPFETYSSETVQTGLDSQAATSFSASRIIDGSSVSESSFTRTDQRSAQQLTAVGSESVMTPRYNAITEEDEEDGDGGSTVHTNRSDAENSTTFNLGRVVAGFAGDVSSALSFKGFQSSGSVHRKDQHGGKMKEQRSEEQEEYVGGVCNDFMQFGDEEEIAIEVEYMEDSMDEEDDDDQNYGGGICSGGNNPHDDSHEPADSSRFDCGGGKVFSSSQSQASFEDFPEKSVRWKRQAV